MMQSAPASTLPLRWIGVRGLEMLLGIAADADAEAGAAVHPADGAHEFVGMGIPAGNGVEALFTGEGIAPEGHHVVDSQEVEVLYQPFNLRGGVPSADDVRDHFHVIPALDAAAYGDGGYPAADDLAEEGAVAFRGEPDLVAMGRDIDIAGLELERMAGIQEIGDSHSRWDRKARASSGEKPRADLYSSY